MAGVVDMLSARRLDGEIVDDIVWDVWQQAVEHEPALREAENPWPILLTETRNVCAGRMRIRRYEFASESTEDLWDR